MFYFGICIYLGVIRIMLVSNITYDTLLHEKGNFLTFTHPYYVSYFNFMCEIIHLYLHR